MAPEQRQALETQRLLVVVAVLAPRVRQPLGAKAVQVVEGSPPPSRAQQRRLAVVVVAVVMVGTARRAQVDPGEVALEVIARGARLELPARAEVVAVGQPTTA